MAEILRVLTPEQISQLGRDYIVGKNSGITNFNDGGVTQSILEAIGLIESTTGADYLQALRKSIPVALYDGLKFTKKGATRSNGFVRFYRLPQFTIRYVGSEPNCDLTINSTTLITSTGNISDDLNIDLTVEDTIQKVVDAINLNANYLASVVPSKELLSSDNLYPYIALDIKSEFDYLNNEGIGVMTNADLEIQIPIGSTFLIDTENYQTTVTSLIADGRDTSIPISFQSLLTGKINDKVAFALDTFNGKGSITSAILGGTVYAITDVAISNGTDEETDDDRALRFQIYINGLNGGTNFNIQAKVLEVPGIRSVTVLERFPAPGTNTIVADKGDGTLSVDDINAIKLKLEGDPNDIANNPGVRQAGIIYNYQAPNVVPLPVTITIKRQGILSDPTEIINAVRTVISNYVNTRRLGEQVVVKEIEGLALFCHPSVYDVSIVTPSANTTPNTDEVLRVGIISAPLTVNLVTI